MLQRACWRGCHRGGHAPDLSAVAAIVVAGARRQATVRDSMVLSLVANAVGAGWGFRSKPGVAQAASVVNITALGALGIVWVRMYGASARSRLPHVLLIHVPSARGAAAWTRCCRHSKPVKQGSQLRPRLRGNARCSQQHGATGS